MTPYLLVAAGGAIGSIGRYWMSGSLDARLNAVLPQLMFPDGPLLVNVLGSFVFGALDRLEEGVTRWGLPTEARQLLKVGFCGGFHAVSSFSLRPLGRTTGGG